MRLHPNANIAKALVAAFWLYGGRALGLVWTLAMISMLGIADYGEYSLSLAISAMVAGTIDHPFAVRSVRVSDEDFLTERTARILMGAAVAALAGCAAILGIGYIAWFGLAVASGEVVFNAYMSLALRQGHADVINRLGAIRQAASVGLGVGYLFAVPQHSLALASVFYLVPYVVVFVLSVPQALAARPAMHEGPRRWLLLSFENFANSLYFPADILLLGLLTDPTIVGYYSIASVVGWAVASLGQSFGQTYHEPLRAAGGAASAGPSMKHAALLAAAGGALVLGVGLAILLSPAPAQIGWATAIMSGFVFLRILTWVFTIVLYLQHRDRLRAVSSATVGVLKLLLIALLVGPVISQADGATATSIACVLAELVLMTWLYAAVHLGGKPGAHRAPAGGTHRGRRQTPTPSDQFSVPAQSEMM